MQGLNIYVLSSLKFVLGQKLSEHLKIRGNSVWGVERLKLFQNSRVKQVRAKFIPKKNAISLDTL